MLEILLETETIRLLFSPLLQLVPDCTSKGARPLRPKWSSSPAAPRKKWQPHMTGALPAHLSSRLLKFIAVSLLSHWWTQSWCPEHTLIPHLHGGLCLREALLVLWFNSKDLLFSAEQLPGLHSQVGGGVSPHPSCLVWNVKSFWGDRNLPAFRHSTWAVSHE